MRCCWLARRGKLMARAVYMPQKTLGLTQLSCTGTVHFSHAIGILTLWTYHAIGILTLWTYHSGEFSCTRSCV